MRIRKCRAGDAAFLAESILIAGRAHVKKGIWEIVLGISEEACLRFLEHLTVTEIPHLFHYSCSFIAEDDRARIIAAISLIKIGSERSTYVVKQGIQFNDSDKVRRMCEHLYHAHLHGDMDDTRTYENEMLAQILIK